MYNSLPTLGLSSNLAPPPLQQHTPTTPHSLYRSSNTSLYTQLLKYHTYTQSLYPYPVFPIPHTYYSTDQLKTPIHTTQRLHTTFTCPPIHVIIAYTMNLPLRIWPCICIHKYLYITMLLLNANSPTIITLLRLFYSYYAVITLK